MKSRVHPKYKTKYRVGNWRAYERALVQRGDVTLWLSADARNSWRPSPSGQPGGQRRFSDLAITTALTLRLVFRLGWDRRRSVSIHAPTPLEAVEFATLTWVDWFNTPRLLGPLGDIPPAEFEAQYYEQAEVA